MGLHPTYMDETHLESMSFDGVDGDMARTLTAQFANLGLANSCT
jgi:hypothetical protein